MLIQEMDVLTKSSHQYISWSTVNPTQQCDNLEVSQHNTDRSLHKTPPLTAVFSTAELIVARQQMTVTYQLFCQNLPAPLTNSFCFCSPHRIEILSDVFFNNCLVSDRLLLLFPSVYFKTLFIIKRFVLVLCQLLKL